MLIKTKMTIGPFYTNIVEYISPVTVREILDL